MAKLLAFLLLCCTPGWCTWTQVQTKNNQCVTVATCAVTVTSTGTGHLIVVGMECCGTAVTISSVTGGGTYSLCGANCQAFNSGWGTTDFAYTLSSVSGATTITANLSGTASAVAIVIWEFSFTNGPISFDVAAKVNNLTNCTTCTGPALAVTGENDVLILEMGCGGTCSAPSAPYGQDWVLSGNEFAHALNTISKVAPTVTQSSSTVVESAAIAFKEAPGGFAVVY